MLFVFVLQGLAEENKRQDRMIEDLLRDGRDKSEQESFNKEPKAEQGITTTKLLTMSFQVSKKTISDIHLNEMFLCVL